MLADATWLLAHACNLITQETKAEGLWMLCHPGLHRKPFHQERKKKETQEERGGEDWREGKWSWRDLENVYSSQRRNWQQIEVMMLPQSNLLSQRVYWVYLQEYRRGVAYREGEYPSPAELPKDHPSMGEASESLTFSTWLVASLWTGESVPFTSPWCLYRLGRQRGPCRLLSFRDSLRLWIVFFPSLRSFLLEIHES